MTDRERALALLGEMESRKAQAGEWEAFASAVITDAHRAYAALRIALAEHWGPLGETGIGRRVEPSDPLAVEQVCACDKDWPCPTVTRLAQALEGSE